MFSFNIFSFARSASRPAPRKAGLSFLALSALAILILTTALLSATAAADNSVRAGKLFTAEARAAQPAAVPSEKPEALASKADQAPPNQEAGGQKQSRPAKQPLKEGTGLERQQADAALAKSGRARKQAGAGKIKAGAGRARKQAGAGQAQQQADADLPQKQAPTAPPAPSCVAESALTGPVTPITLDILKKTVEFAEAEDCRSILLTIDTPGGSLPATRQIVQEILQSPRPFLCLISPPGGQATSAGAIILQACHVSGALKGTNVGAATPVALGRQIPKESDMRKKMLNDTAAFVETLTSLRGRSKDFGRAIVLEAKSVTAEEAKKLKAIDWTGETKAGFLSFAAGRETELAGGKTTVVQTGPIKIFQKSFRYSVLNFFADPQLLYMIFLGSAALIYFELTHPGALLPGIVGGIGLILSLVGLNLLSVTWGALALILLAIGLFAAEALAPSFGLLGIGGAVAFVLGSLYLFDPVQTGYSISLSLIFPAAVFFGLIVFGVSWLALKTVKMKKCKTGFDSLAGLRGEVTKIAEAGDEAGRSAPGFPSILPPKQAKESGFMYKIKVGGARPGAGLAQKQAGEARPVASQAQQQAAAESAPAHSPTAGRRGWVFLNGENWRFVSSEKVAKGATVEVLSSKRMILKVRPVSQNEEESWS